MAEQDWKICGSCASSDLSEPYDFAGISYYTCRRCLKESYINDDNTTQLCNEGYTNLASLWNIAKCLDPEEHVPSLSPGDHIMWQRSYVVCHHAIIIEVSKDKQTTSVYQSKKLKVIHWAKIEKDGSSSIEISEKTINDPFLENGDLYKILYTKSVNSKNPSQLVVKRARALIGTKGYHFLQRNCEDFARFCKTGDNFSLQGAWLRRKFLDTTMCSLQTAVYIFMLKFLFMDQRALTLDLLWLSSIIILRNIAQMPREMRQTWFDPNFRYAITTCILEFILGATMMITGFVGSQHLCTYIGDSICHGAGTEDGFIIRPSHVFACFTTDVLFCPIFLGGLASVLLCILGKAVGMALGIHICKMFNYFTSCGKTISDKNTNFDVDNKRNRRVMSRSRYRFLKKVTGGILMLGWACYAFGILVCFYHIITYIELFEENLGTYITETNVFKSSFQPQCTWDDNSENFNELYKFTHLLSCDTNDIQFSTEFYKFVSYFRDPGTNFTFYNKPRNAAVVIKHREYCKEIGKCHMGVHLMPFLCFLTDIWSGLFYNHPFVILLYVA